MKKLLSILFLASIAISCQKNKESNETKEDAQVSESFDQQRDAFFANMLAPGEAAATLQATAADFNASLMNDPKLVASYAKDEEKAAANLGVYLADLNYSVAYKESANTKELFTSAVELSKVVGIEESVLTFLMKRYEDNISQNDSLQNVFNTLFEKSTTGLKGTDREAYVGIAMAAYQIENLHLAVGVVETYPKDMLPTDARTQILIPVYRMILDQQKNVENIYAFLKTVTDPKNPENPNYAYYSKSFEELIEVYKRLDVDEKIANNQGLELMKDSVIQELGSKINAIRSKIVSQ